MAIAITIAPPTKYRSPNPNAGPPAPTNGIVVDQSLRDRGPGHPKVLDRAPTPATDAKNRVAAARSKGYEGTPEDRALALEGDLPSIIVARTKERLIDNEIEPQVKDGIAAQAILERRQERMEDKAFMLNLARALAGGGFVQPRVIGETPDGNEVLALAPPEMRVG